MRKFLNQTVIIPYGAMQSVTAVTITIIRLSDDTRVVNAASMTASVDNFWKYSWTIPKATEDYQVWFNDGSFSYAGPIIEVGGGIVFTVQSDVGNSSTQFKTDLTDTANDHYRGPHIVKWLDGALMLQDSRLPNSGAYNGTTKIITVSTAFTGTPANGVKGVVITG